MLLKKKHEESAPADPRYLLRDFLFLFILVVGAKMWLPGALGQIVPAEGTVETHRVSPGLGMGSLAVGGEARGSARTQGT